MKDVRKMLSQALTEICEYKSLDNVTVTEITKQAGLTRQVFYRHYVDKYDLAKYIHLQEYYLALDEIEIGEKTGPHMWSRISSVWFDVIKKNPQFYQNIYRSNSGDEFKRIVRTYITNFYMGIVRRQQGKNIESEVLFVIELYLAGATEKINDWIISGARLSVEELNQLLYIAMPEKIRDLIIFNEVDIESAKEIARTAYPK